MATEVVEIHMDNETDAYRAMVALCEALGFEPRNVGQIVITPHEITIVHIDRSVKFRDPLFRRVTVYPLRKPATVEAVDQYQPRPSPAPSV